jgi:Tfp pilus assembly protein PilF
MPVFLFGVWYLMFGIWILDFVTLEFGIWILAFGIWCFLYDMKIFGINFSPDADFKITENDKVWVDENFRWLKEVFGYPNKHHEQILFTPAFFPSTFERNAVSVESLITDLCKLLDLPKNCVRCIVLSDFPDTPNEQNEAGGQLVEFKTELTKGDYTLYVANSLLKHPDRLLSSLVYEFVRIRLTESAIGFDSGGDDTDLFVYLAGTYYGFGVLMAQNLVNIGNSTRETWEIRWRVTPQMPLQVMAYTLAAYANLRGETDPQWKNELKGDFRGMFEGALSYLAKNPNGLYNESEVKANELFDESCQHFDKHEFGKAIEVLQKILFLTTDDHMKADVYNNMGYYYIRTGNYSQAIANFRKALALGPEYGYANDNLGYALIITGKFDEGLAYVQKAIETGNNDRAYSFRNLALYHQMKGDFVKAEEFYQTAFAEGTPVDLLEYHYGEFLLQTGDSEGAEVYFQKSAEKNEMEGLNRISRQ